MKQRLLLLLLSFLCFGKLLCQPAYQWSAPLHSYLAAEANDVVADDSGNVYSAGIFTDSMDADPGPGVYTLHSAGQEDIFIIKLNPAGNLIWAKEIGGPSREYIYRITLDNNGHLIIPGFFNLTVDFDPGPGVSNLTVVGGENGFVLKLDASGNYLDVKGLLGSGAIWPHSVTTDSASNIYLAISLMGNVDCDPGSGVYSLTSAGSWDAVICKYDSAMNLLWAKRMGSSDWDIVNAIRVDAFGNVYSVGNFSNVGDYDPGPGIYNLVCAGNENVFISKLDSTGNFVWAKALRGSIYSHCWGLAVDPAGNAYLSGGYMGSVDFDPDGGTFILTSAGAWGWNPYVCKLNSSGGFCCAKDFGAGGYSAAITLDKAGIVSSTGYIHGDTIDFDPGPGVFNVFQYSYQVAYISQLDTAGNFYSAGILQDSSCYSQGISIFSNSKGLYLSGKFAFNCDFDQDAAVANQNGGSNDDAFIARYISRPDTPPVITGIGGMEEGSFQIFPNPSTGIFKIQMLNEFADAKITIYNSSGLLVRSQLSKNELDLRDAPNGIYFVKIETDKKVLVKKIIKQ